MTPYLFENFFRMGKYPPLGLLYILGGPSLKIISGVAYRDYITLRKDKPISGLHALPASIYKARDSTTVTSSLVSPALGI